MHKSTVRFYALAALLVVPLLASANSDAYNAGYRVGAIVGKSLPVLIVAVLLLAGWLVYRSRKKRSCNDNDQQV